MRKGPAPPVPPRKSSIQIGRSIEDEEDSVNDGGAGGSIGPFQSTARRTEPGSSQVPRPPPSSGREEVDDEEGGEGEVGGPGFEVDTEPPVEGWDLDPKEKEMYEMMVSQEGGEGGAGGRKAEMTSSETQSSEGRMGGPPVAPVGLSSALQVPESQLPSMDVDPQSQQSLPPQTRPAATDTSTLPPFGSVTESSSKRSYDPAKEAALADMTPTQMSGASRPTIVDPSTAVEEDSSLLQLPPPPPPLLPTQDQSAAEGGETRESITDEEIDRMNDPDDPEALPLVLRRIARSLQLSDEDKEELTVLMGDVTAYASA